MQEAVIAQQKILNCLKHVSRVNVQVGKAAAGDGAKEITISVIKEEAKNSVDGSLKHNQQI